MYTTNGFFGAHKDHLALTVLIPLTPPADFTGGGTGFWAGNRETTENPDAPPTRVIAPPIGTALVFGGDVTHAGMPVDGGLRSVLVASFSTRTAASAEDRVQGLQCAPSSFTRHESSARSALVKEGAQRLAAGVQPEQSSDTLTTDCDGLGDGGFGVAQSAEEGEWMEVVCPNGLLPDRTLRVALPDGREFEVEVPDGVEAGDAFVVGPFPPT